MLGDQTKITISEFTDAVASALLNQALWHHLPQKDHDEE